MRETFAVPCGVRRLIRPAYRGQIAPLLERLVRAEHGLGIQGKLFFQHYLLRRLDSYPLPADSPPGPFPFGPNVRQLNQTLLNRCKIAVSVATQGAQELPDLGLPMGFLEARDDHLQWRPEGFVPIQRPGYLSNVSLTPLPFHVLHSAPMPSVIRRLTRGLETQVTNCTNRQESVNFSNHVSTNFRPFTMRLLQTVAVQRRYGLKIAMGPAPPERPHQVPTF